MMHSMDLEKEYEVGINAVDGMETEDSARTANRCCGRMDTEDSARGLSDGLFCQVCLNEAVGFMCFVEV